MEWFSDEFLFYGGLALAGFAVFAAIVIFSVLQIKKVRLEARFDAEYGAKEKKKK